MIRDFIRNWLPGYLKILSEEIRLEKYNTQMHLLWDKTYNQSASVNDICNALREMNWKSKEKSKANNGRRTRRRRRAT